MLLLDINVIKNTVVIIQIKCTNVKCMVPIFYWWWVFRKIRENKEVKTQLF